MSETTRLVADLPDLKVEILHRQDPAAGLEHLYLHLAVPSAMLASPFAAWAALGQMAAHSWLTLAQAASPLPWAGNWPGLPAPRHSRESDAG